jgi:hypothetical protein
LKVTTFADEDRGTVTRKRIGLLNGVSAGTLDVGVAAPVVGGEPGTVVPEVPGAVVVGEPGTVVGTVVTVGHSSDVGVVVGVAVVGITELDGVVDGVEGAAVGVRSGAGPYITQMITWLIDLSPRRPPESATPFPFESAKTNEPPTGFGNTVFTWKFGSVDMMEPAFTFTRE